MKQQSANKWPILLEKRRFADARGWFMSLGDETDLARWRQENVSFSRKGVLRGLHFQHPNGQAKLVTVLAGEIFDVAIDLRLGSPKFGVAQTFSLSSSGAHCSLFLPRGYAHGFYVKSEQAIVHYHSSEIWHPKFEHVLRWDDPAIGIHWQLTGAPILSAKDENGRLLASFAQEELPVFDA